MVSNINGRKVIDATDSMELVVTDTDCELATRRNHSSCAVARACMKRTGTDALIHLSRVYVKQHKLHENDEDIWVRFIVKNSLRTQIVAFDQGGSFAPGTYKLHAPRKNHRLGKYHTGKKASGTENINRRRQPTVLKDVRTGASRGHNFDISPSNYKG